ncbi:MAG: VIT1/CCC1 family protein [Acidilobaceae archaeon]
MSGGQLERLAFRFCRDELNAYTVYRELSRVERDPELREALARAAERELAHYEFWRSLAGGDCGSVDRVKVGLVLLSRRLLGLVFALRLLERSEREATRGYRAVAEMLPESARSKLEEIVRDEEEHEEAWVRAIAREEKIVRYLGFVALGVADSIVELTGVFAGFLGATASTEAAGLAGLVVGVAAALSMSGAAYAQAKHEAEGRVSPLASAIVTGLSYIIVVALLTAPYLLLDSVLAALVASLAVATALVASFTLYSSIIKNTDYARDLAETLAVMATTIVVAYIVGHALGELLDLPRTPL